MAQASRKRASDTPVIPDRLYFKIGDVARICGIETYVLRFWETQFPQLKPNKSGTGQRLYRRRDVELALEIQRLVHKEGYTIAGARQALEAGPRKQAPQPAPELKAEVRPEPVAESAIAARPPAPVLETPAVVKATLAQVRSQLRELSAQLANPAPTAQPAWPQRRDASQRPKVIRVRPESDSLFPL